MIPKVIHYCWFGGGELPYRLQNCVNSWGELEGYQFVRWDETNCSFDENEFVRRAYKEKKYGHIGDYYRLKALYENGGIYLDTDVWINKPFDDLLDQPCFLNYIFDSVVGTAIIGAEKGNPFIKGLLDMYDHAYYGVPTNGKFIEETEKGICAGVKGFFPTSNYFFTTYILQKYADFHLNNQFQDMGDFVIYPKELFEIGTWNFKHYATHLCDGAWLIGRRKMTLHRLFLSTKLGKSIQCIIRARRYKRLNKKSPFYEIAMREVS